MSYLNRVDSAESAMAFYAALHEFGMLFHPEDPAADCLQHHGLAHWAIAQIERNRIASFKYLKDPCEIALQLLNGESV